MIHHAVAHVERSFSDGKHFPSPAVLTMYSDRNAGE